MSQDVSTPGQPGALTRRVVPAVVVVAGVATGAALAGTHRPSGSGPGANSAYGAGKPAAADAKPVATVSQIPANGGLVLNNQAVVVTKDASGTVHAFSAICTHQGCTVSKIGNGTIDCPCHGSRFNASTGAVVNGPASNPLPPVAVRLEGDDIYLS